MRHEPGGVDDGNVVALGKARDPMPAVFVVSNSSQGGCDRPVARNRTACWDPQPTHVYAGCDIMAAFAPSVSTSSLIPDREIPRARRIRRSILSQRYRSDTGAKNRQQPTPELIRVFEHHCVQDANPRRGPGDRPRDGREDPFVTGEHAFARALGDPNSPDSLWP